MMAAHASEDSASASPAPEQTSMRPTCAGWHRASWVRQLFFLHVDSLVAHGYRTRIEPNDVWTEETLKTEHLLRLFEPALEEQVARHAEDTARLKAKLQALTVEAAQPSACSAGAPRPGPPSVHSNICDKANGPHVSHSCSDIASDASKPGKPEEDTCAVRIPSLATTTSTGRGQGSPTVAQPQSAPAQQQQTRLHRRITRSESILDLKRVVLAGNRQALMGTGLLYLTAQACSLAGPLLLQRIVSGLLCTDATCAPRNTLYWYCLGLFLAPLIQSLAENHQLYLLYLTGTRMRNALMTAIFRKGLKLSNATLQEESTGRVITLMSNDAQKVQAAVMAIHVTWGSPCYIIVVVVLLYQQIGWATFVGLAVILLLGPVTGHLTTKLSQLRNSMMQWTDQRVGYLSEIISGIQMIKMYAWEGPLADKVQASRAEETRILRATTTRGAALEAVFSGPALVAVFCFGAYSLAGNTLNNANAYTALAYLDLLRQSMMMMPALMAKAINGLVALKRIGTFLMKEESQLSKEALDLSYPAGEVVIEEGEFACQSDQAVPTLKGINMTVKQGSLTMVVGGVGSGKSSMLGALVGHMVKHAGRVKVGGTVAYVAQSAWIMNDTLRENVTLGDKTVDPAKYQMAIEVSQLKPDLKMLPNGELTEIGDRGITLSGGQKQRVSIARAVYADADVYLLDDPLSAVDSHVGRALFEECIQGALKDKTVLLVTNSLQYLPHADHVIWMEDGRIRAQGTYTQLVGAGLRVDELIHEEGPAQPWQEADDMFIEINTVTGSGKTNELIARQQNSHHQAARVSPVIGKEDASGVNGLLGHDDAATSRNLTVEEERGEGAMSWAVVQQYFKAGGGWRAMASIVLLFTLEQSLNAYTDRWVGVWFGDSYNQSLGLYLGVYLGLTVVYSMVCLFRTIRFLFMCVDSSINLHSALVTHVLRLPKQFFDTNPSGRILNRFSRDVDIMDSALPNSLMQLAECMAVNLCILVVISVTTKWFAIGLVPLAAIYIIVQRYYIPTARDLQRIESVSRSPIYIKFSEALQGMCTIRAYRKEQHFTEVSDRLMESNANAFMTQKLAASWLAMRLDLMGLLVLTSCGALVIQGNLDPGLAGLALMYALALTHYLKHGANMASEVETDFNSVDRIVQYLRPAPETAPETSPEVLRTLPATWPSLGALEVADLILRYRPELPLVLKGVTFKVEGGEKVGLVGKTGSGKSSIFLALFRLVEPTSGSVWIDGVDTRTLGLRHLRTSMSIIPQDPFMFSGTVRNNLDPFEEHADARLWHVLAAVGLKAVISALDLGLGARVADNGTNFSLGQRQLFCMARAMLRNSRLLMLDEATASMDVDTDSLVQDTIRSVFASCTVLTIAHRLNTIMDSDRVIVLDQGRVMECDHADELLKMDSGIFNSMVSQTGPSSSRYLRSLASSAFSDRQSRIQRL